MTDHEDKKTSRRVKSHDAYIQRKIEAWERNGTPSGVNPLTGAACPKWKIELDEKARKARERSR